MPKYISGIFLDFDNVFSSLFKQSKDAAKEFATDPAHWLGAFQGMRGSEVEDTSQNFVIRRCYMNPVGRVQNSAPYSAYRQSFVRDRWEVIDTPPLTNQGKTSADTHIVMDVLDSVARYPHVDEYVIMAADADYTPLVIRLRKHMKTTIVYAAKETSVAYRAACDFIIDERNTQPDTGATAETSAGIPSNQPSPEKVADVVNQYFADLKRDIGPTWRRSVTCCAFSFRQFQRPDRTFIAQPVAQESLPTKDREYRKPTLAWKE